ncbi:hypothetical protein CGRA01v4_09685 [Colletotrichum graminicola]|nr:hypothetical protein CGRA01v4_09685 [Colletotrichum graminicola]
MPLVSQLFLLSPIRPHFPEYLSNVADCYRDRAGNARWMCGERNCPASYTRINLH